MATFEVHQLEGTHYVDATLDNETIRAEAGALCYMKGDITMRSRFLPSVRSVIASLLADEAVYRPIYTGTGTITLESSLGGFHMIDLQDEDWILEKGAYWASEGAVDVSFYRESLLTSLWAGEGFVYLQTRVRGRGKVVLATRGPVEEVELQPGQRIAVEGKFVIGRRKGVGFHIRRASRNFMGRFTSGEGPLRVFEGPGHLLLNPTPYWRYLAAMRRGDAGLL